MRHFVFLFIASLLLGFSLPAQDMQKNLRQHVQFLADDLMQGRMTASREEQLCAAYLFAQWGSMGYAPAFEKKWLQPFSFPKERLPATNPVCVCDGEPITHQRIRVLPFSGKKKAKGKLLYLSADSLSATAIAAQVKGRILCLSADSVLQNPHAPEGGALALREQAEKAQQAGASGLIFYASSALCTAAKWSFSGFRSLDIPVVLVADLSATYSRAVLKASVEETWAVGHNVGGWLNRNRPFTIILGAHYDHLGWGENGHSLSTEIPSIHNGADDNASGVSALLEISRLLARDTAFPFNVLVLGFSGEELGLLGSRYLADHSPVDISRVQCMLNYDMVGRVDSNATLILNGIGTSPSFGEWVSRYKGFFNLKTTASGMGPSDHSSFYKKQIPVIHFFSGLHQDYHKPQDDESKINYPALEEVVKLSVQFLKDLPGSEKIAFTHTNDASQAATPRFKVTLGIFPDYTYTGTGVRADGISPGKPAAAAGLQAGDIIIGMGNVVIHDMMSYMQALSSFSKGSEAIVRLLRDKKEMEITIRF